MSRLYQQLKNWYHWGQAWGWSLWHGRPEKDLVIFGVTGTNGKTTTSIVLGSILRAAYGQDKIGLLTTEVFWFGAAEESNTTHMTSTDARLVFRNLRRMVKAGVSHVVLEMTSHALDQHRLAGIGLSGAIILNIKHEHLDYHKTMEAYAEAKMRIRNYLKPGTPFVYKSDDTWIQYGLREFSISNSQFSNIEFTSAQAHQVQTPLPGDFNQENVLAASLLAEAIGINRDTIQRGVQMVRQVPGRMEWIEAPGGFRVLVDFALTPYAYERLFSYLRGETQGRLIAVFGAAGRRDKEKRPIISKLVARYADEIILTQDEPYDDPEEEIYAQLERGLDPACKIDPASAPPAGGATAGTLPSKSATHCKVVWGRIEDRREAIRYAVQQARSGDVVVVTGMGNFDTRIVGNKAIPWNDKKVILELLGEL